MKIFTAISLTISYMITWGLLCNDSISKSQLGVFVALLYTFFSVVIMSNGAPIPKLQKAILSIGPILYLIVDIVYTSNWLLLFIDPITIAFLVFNYSLHSCQKKLRSKTNLFFVVFILTFYSLVGYTYWEFFLNLKTEETEFSFEKTVTSFIPNTNLGSFQFLNHEKKMISIAPKHKLTIIETWNEGCMPCKNLIRDLKPFTDSLNHQLDHYYVYENLRKVTLDYESIINHNWIKSPKQILIDQNSNYYNSNQMNSYPVMLFYDKNGNLIRSIKGYNPKAIQKYKNEILNILIAQQ